MNFFLKKKMKYDQGSTLNRNASIQMIAEVEKRKAAKQITITVRDVIQQQQLNIIPQMRFGDDSV